MPSGAVRQPDMRASAIDLQQMLRPVASMRTGVFQLPPDIDDFTGREDDLRAVQSGLEPATDHADVIVSAIAGRAGVGKTALATKLAHQLQPRFPRSPAWSWRPSPASATPTPPTSSPGTSPSPWPGRPGIGGGASGGAGAAGPAGLGRPVGPGRPVAVLPRLLPQALAAVGPRLPADYVLLDEAQDANPVVAAIVDRQTHAQRILVGDRCQGIDAMSRFHADHRLCLSQSFRFAPAIAAEANQWLGLLDAPLRLRGFDRIPSTVGPVAVPDAVLCRTNAEAVRQLLVAADTGRTAAPGRRRGRDPPAGRGRHQPARRVRHRPP
jgi:hypothetical protein